jgi:hypothetical protein
VDTFLDILSKTDLGPAASKLVEKVSKAIGTPATALMKIPNAMIDSAVREINAKAEVNAEFAAKLERIKQFSALEQFANVERIKQILGKTALMLEDQSDPDRVDDDWIVYYLDKARLVSDEEMQNLWAKILAGESNSPGSYSKRTLDFLSTLEKREAYDFTTLGSLVVYHTDSPTYPLPLIFTQDLAYPTTKGLSYLNLDNLEAIGLIKSVFPSWSIKSFRPVFELSYFKETRQFQSKDTVETNPSLFRLKCGQYKLTQTGDQLLKIAGSTPFPDFWSYLTAAFAKNQVTPI